MIPRQGSTNLGLSGRGTWGRLLGKAFSKTFPFLLACNSLQSTDLGLSAACDTEVKKDKVVRGQVAWPKSEGPFLSNWKQPCF